MHYNRGRAPEWGHVSQHATPPARPRPAAQRSRHGIRSATFAATTLGLAAFLVACAPAPVTTPAPTLAATPTFAQTPTAETPTAQPTPQPTPDPTQAAGADACAPGDLKASHGFVEGAAGSRLTTVVLTSASTCSVYAFPALGLRDARGAILVGAASGGPGRLDLAAGGVYETNVRLANWCAAEPDFPLALEIVLGSGELSVTGTSFPEQGDLPPCSGGSGPILEATEWVAAAE